MGYLQDLSTAFKKVWSDISTDIACWERESWLKLQGAHHTEGGYIIPIKHINTPELILRQGHCLVLIRLFYKKLHIINKHNLYDILQKKENLTV